MHVPRHIHSSRTSASVACSERNWRRRLRHVAYLYWILLSAFIFFGRLPTPRHVRRSISRFETCREDVAREEWAPSPDSEVTAS